MEMPQHVKKNMHRILHYFSDPLSELLDDSGVLDATRVEDWMRRNNIDPNDPANLDLMERVAEANKNASAAVAAAAVASAVEGEGAEAQQQLDLMPPPGGHFR